MLVNKVFNISVFEGLEVVLDIILMLREVLA